MANDAPHTPAQYGPRRVLFIGDSITDCDRRGDPEGLGSGYVRLIAEALAGAGEDVEIINRGISGNRSADVLARLDEDCLALDPDAVTLYVGVNDTWWRYLHDDPTSDAVFERRVAEILTRIRDRIGGEAPLVVMLPFVLDVDAAKARFHEDLDGKVAVLRSLADRFGARTVDLARAMGEALETGASPALLAPDGVHPSMLGHRILAREWLTAQG